MTTAKTILRDNLNRLAKKRGLWNEREDYANQSALSRLVRGRLDQTTIRKMVKDVPTSPNLESIEIMADGFNLEPWQLLVPGLDPMSPPTLSADPKARILTPEQSRLVTMFADLPEADQQAGLSLFASLWAKHMLEKRNS